ncbi:MAG: hypothetical protein ACTHKU_02335, partial [Verrucomicrobiota bacterium]
DEGSIPFTRSTSNFPTKSKLSENTLGFSPEVRMIVRIAHAKLPQNRCEKRHEELRATVKNIWNNYSSTFPNPLM